MNIDWSKAPEGATHYNEDWQCTSKDGVQYYKREGKNWAFWTEHANPNHWEKSGLPCKPVTEIPKTPARKRAEGIEAMFEDCGYDGGGATYYTCAGLWDAGYRKFEIVEENV